MKRFLFVVGLSLTMFAAQSTAGGEARKLDVYARDEEIWVASRNVTQLFCNYNLSTGEDRPVTITWKVGDGPRSAIPIYTCSGWTKASKSCTLEIVEEGHFANRIGIAQDSPSLKITNVDPRDNRNYWCQIAVEDPNDYELEFGMQSMVLRIYDGENSPKFHTVTIETDKVAGVGNNVTIDCECVGYHCDDVFWYKGPLQASEVDYDLVYSRVSQFRPVPTQYQAYNQWVGRAFLTGNALNIIGVTAEDSGRYWCELRSSGFYAIGELSTDAESMALEVMEERGEKPFDCSGKPDGLYDNADGCTLFYECYDQRLFRRECALGTVFNVNPDPWVCDHPYNVAPPCGTKGSP